MITGATVADSVAPVNSEAVDVADEEKRALVDDDPDPSWMARAEMPIIEMASRLLIATSTPGDGVALPARLAIAEGLVRALHRVEGEGDR